ncbi:hypothetical protein [Paraburkholderia terricola]|uniref:hypothetical protein n=1 Tax=Paraburkholderia terricola TaxID=169427 RepID=UPI001FCFD2D4|nr:hypothetical protein [Paraburkholderia terricola]
MLTRWRRYQVRNVSGRRRALSKLAALAAAMLPLARPTASFAAVADSQLQASRGRRITDMLGTNGWAGSASDLAMWREMGLTWGRDSVGPGQPDSPRDPMRVDRTGVQYNSELPPVVIRNNRNGVRSLLLLAYTPKWNASVPGDSKSAPIDVDAWKRYVDAVVRKYAAPPYNLRHFQIWNEAAGKLSGGQVQASFWHGPHFNEDRKLSRPYERAMQDYVERIHLPAARIIRSYGAYVVYGGWPDQGGLDNFRRWLEYRSPLYDERMLDQVDYIDTHYLPVHELDPLYEQYVKHGPARGIWQTEIGDTYMKDPHYLPRYFFEFAAWALDREWNDPNKYVSMIYHWDGYEPFRLTHRGPPARTYNVSGQSLVVLRRTVAGSLQRFPAPLAFGGDTSGTAVLSDSDIVIQVSAATGWRSVTATGVKPPAARTATVEMIDGLTGARSDGENIALTWKDATLNVRFKVPSEVNGPLAKPPRHLAYIVVRRAA